MSLCLCAPLDSRYPNAYFGRTSCKKTCKQLLLTTTPSALCARTITNKKKRIVRFFLKDDIRALIQEQARRFTRQLQDVRTTLQQTIDVQGQAIEVLQRTSDDQNQTIVALQQTVEEKRETIEQQQTSLEQVSFALQQSIQNSGLLIATLQQSVRSQNQSIGQQQISVEQLNDTLQMFMQTQEASNNEQESIAANLTALTSLTPPRKCTSTITICRYTCSCMQA